VARGNHISASSVGYSGNFFGFRFVSETRGNMRDYLTNLTPKVRMFLAVPIVVIAYPVITILLPAIVRAVIPDVVRSVLSLI
jgi:hypothetical protein